MLLRTRYSASNKKSCKEIEVLVLAITTPFQANYLPKLKRTKLDSSLSTHRQLKLIEHNKKEMIGNERWRKKGHE